LFFQEEIAERPGGVKLVVRPADFSLARVSVLSAKSDQGHCIIDDYIATKDSSIVDYLTQFSGIVKGDLDPTTSKHHVTSLKMAYLKLRWLVDRGCKFIGHGLAKDFRIMNLVVPKEQIIDTVELFYLDRQRKISLKFLASHLLGMDIQMETHDSIEDARTALLLYRKYQDLQHDGDFTEVLNEIYNVGRSQQWKLGGRDATSPISPPQDSTSSIPEFPTQ
jgi:PAB-dependent poly(A)-specific ribonuclease subunit 2